MVRGCQDVHFPPHFDPNLNSQNSIMSLILPRTTAQQGLIFISCFRPLERGWEGPFLSVTRSAFFLYPHPFAVVGRRASPEPAVTAVLDVLRRPQQRAEAIIQKSENM